jgi:phosphatidylglycerophosphate synthase
MDNKFNPFWEFCVSNISKKVAPNLLTCIGIIVPIISFIYLCTYDLSCSIVLPPSVFLLGAFSMFWYQTIDAIDGK